MQSDVQKFGLIPETPDPRDFSQEKVFGAISLTDVPNGDFFVSDPIKIKNQGGTDFCVGFAAAAVVEDHEHTELSGPFLYSAAKKLITETSGNSEEWRKWGLQIRDVCNVLIKVGALEEDLSPFKGETSDYLRDDLANPKNWGEDYEMLAAEHRQSSYFNVDGPHDTFDNFRAALWRGKQSGGSILTGVLWRYSWSQAPGGIIPKDYDATEGGEPHALKIFGQMLVKLHEHDQYGCLEDGSCDIPESEELMLVAQLSNGEDIGDKGLFYLPRNVVNKEFVYGAKQFSDMPKGEAKTYMEHGLKVNDGRFYKLAVVALHWLLASAGLR